MKLSLKYDLHHRFSTVPAIPSLYKALCMIDSREAIASVILNSFELPKLKMKLRDAFGYVLAENVHSRINMPPFNQSAMDGYAISDSEALEFNVVGEVKAGDNANKGINPQEAIRVFTGAMIPPGTYAVVKQEDVIRTENKITLALTVNRNSNVRIRGEQISAGLTALQAGTRLNAGAIGYLATLGIEDVVVYKKPRVSIVTTGNELSPPGKELTPGKIFESNSVMLEAALKSEGIQCSIVTVVDDPGKIASALSSAVQNSDLVLVTGGVSVGDYDFVAEAFNDIGIKKVFHRIAQKPGKPLYFGMSKNCVVFGLPGNPGAALSCFYIYVIPSIRQMQCRNDKELIRTRARITEAYVKTNDFTHFLKGRLKKGSVDLLPRQSSAMLSDFAQGNCLVVLEGEAKQWEKGDFVDIILLPE